jgi:hypothetical protein
VIAMHAPDGVLVDTTYLTIYDPTTRPASFLGLETVVLACGVLTFLHALRARRRGDGGALFAWTSIFVYGVALEILSYNAFPSFVHGQFTVMLYHRKLPFYITAVYPVLIYTADRTVRRLGLSRLVEPLVVGFTIVTIDFPFDVVGPDAGWWAWDMHDPNVHDRWYGVPVTSYYWHLTWGAILTALCRWMEPRMKALAEPGPARRFARLLYAFPIAAGTMALGRAAFLPFDVLGPRGVSGGAIVLAAFGVALALLAFGRRAPEADRAADRMLLAIPCAFYGFHAIVAIASFGRVADPVGKMAVVAGATAFAIALNVAAHRRVANERALATA